MTVSIERCAICSAQIDSDRDDQCYADLVPLCVEHRQPDAPPALQVDAAEMYADMPHEPEDPTPYCSYGHRAKVQCDCGPIAENE